jgi:hypothetical protein
MEPDDPLVSQKLAHTVTPYFRYTWMPHTLIYVYVFQVVPFFQIFVLKFCMNFFALTSMLQALPLSSSLVWSTQKYNTTICAVFKRSYDTHESGNFVLDLNGLVSCFLTWAYTYNSGMVNFYRSVLRRPSVTTRQTKQVLIIPWDAAICQTDFCQTKTDSEWPNYWLPLWLQCIEISQTASTGSNCKLSWSFHDAVLNAKVSIVWSISLQCRRLRNQSTKLQFITCTVFKNKLRSWHECWVFNSKYLFLY